MLISIYILKNIERTKCFLRNFSAKIIKFRESFAENHFLTKKFQKVRKNKHELILASYFAILTLRTVVFSEAEYLVSSITFPDRSFGELNSMKSAPFW